MSVSEIKVAIINTIESGITHYKDIAAKLNKTEGNIRKTLSVMKKAGQVVPTGNGHYQLPIVQVPIADSLKPGPAPMMRITDYIKSNEKALQLLVKTREIVSKLMNDYETGKGDFPAQAVTSLEKLEWIYKEQLQTKTEESQKFQERN